MNCNDITLFVVAVQDANIRLCDFGSCVTGHISIATPFERSVEEERISKTTTQMYRAPEMVDLYLRNILTEKTDVWVSYPFFLFLARM